MKISQSLPLIYLITDGTLTNDNYEKHALETLRLIELAVNAGVSLIQIREKNLSARLLFELTLRAVSISRNTRAKILVNDRADVAYVAGADGVHLTEKSLAVDDVRKSFPDLELIGVSVHLLEGVKNAERNGADFAVFGPVFGSPGKGEPVGVERLKEICVAVEPFPVLALGGIDASNYGKALKAGAKGFAAIRFLNDAASFSLLADRGLLPVKKSPF